MTKRTDFVDRPISTKSVLLAIVNAIAMISRMLIDVINYATRIATVIILRSNCTISTIMESTVFPYIGGN